MREVEIIKNVVCSGEEQVMCPRSMFMQETGDVDWVGCNTKCAWFTRRAGLSTEDIALNVMFACCKDTCIGRIKEPDNG